ncbi:hypothetical protein KC734_19825 [candidate division KSB1 bacterium]|nr:hypothetical protein [candidate division KSB1 bacterium]
MLAFNLIRSKTICIFSVLLLAILPVNELQAQIAPTLEAELIGSPDVLFLRNLNILGSQGSIGGNPLFRVRMDGYGLTEVCKVKLRFAIFSENYMVDVIRGVTDEFDIRPNQVIEITDVDITTSSVSDSIRLAGPLEFNASLANALQQDILRTSRLPNGRYIITVALDKTIPPEPNFRSRIIIIDISNPTSLDLISPGLPVYYDFCPDVYTTFPQFSWASNADKFILTVCQVQPENVSPEDVMQNQPRARLELRRNVHFFGTPLILYPAVGALPLVEGGTYYWQVQAVAESPGSEVQWSSEIWCFRIAELDDISRRLMSSSIENILRTLLAGTPFEYLLDENGPLNGFNPSGAVQFNGKDIDLFDLINLLKQAAAGEISISDVNVE